MLDTGAHFYDVYECADGEFVSVGAIEPQFYAVLLEKTGLADDAEFLRQNDKSLWPKLKERLAAVIATRTRDEWAAIFDGTDVCVAPILSLGEAPGHPHNVARSTFVERDGIVQPAPAPRFSRTEAAIRAPAGPRRPAHRRGAGRVGRGRRRAHRRAARVRRHRLRPAAPGRGSTGRR